MIRPRLLAPTIASLALTGIIGLSVAPPALAATGGSTTATAASTSAHKAKATIAPLTIPATTTTHGTLAGTFTPTSFSTSNGVLNVTGVVTGTLTSPTRRRSERQLGDHRRRHLHGDD